MPVSRSIFSHCFFNDAALGWINRLPESPLSNQIKYSIASTRCNNCQTYSPSKSHPLSQASFIRALIYYICCPIYLAKSSQHIWKPGLSLTRRITITLDNNITQQQFPVHLKHPLGIKHNRRDNYQVDYKIHP